LRVSKTGGSLRREDYYSTSTLCNQKALKSRIFVGEIDTLGLVDDSNDRGRRDETKGRVRGLAIKVRNDRPRIRRICADLIVRIRLTAQSVVDSPSNMEPGHYSILTGPALGENSIVRFRGRRLGEATLASK
jgi:hypothetical protein